jgi:hypothetical protein
MYASKQTRLLSHRSGNIVHDDLSNFLPAISHTSFEYRLHPFGHRLSHRQIPFGFRCADQEWIHASTKEVRLLLSHGRSCRRRQGRHLDRDFRTQFRRAEFLAVLDQLPVLPK